MALTGNNREKVEGQLHHYPQTPEKWLFSEADRVWYLSDAGYSRVFFSTERGRLSLTYNSTERVKARWNQAEPQRRQVEEVVRNELRRLGWTLPFSESMKADKQAMKTVAPGTFKRSSLAAANKGQDRREYQVKKGRLLKKLCVREAHEVVSGLLD